jgi:hypothetical protein
VTTLETEKRKAQNEDKPTARQTKSMIKPRVNSRWKKIEVI